MRRNVLRIALASAIFFSAAAAGFLFSSQLGQNLVHQEVERQLARMLRGEVTIESVRLVIGDGLWLKAERVDVYPAERETLETREGLPAVSAPLSGALSAESVAARLDILALLGGRLRLRVVEIEGLHLRLERLGGGNWSLPPLQSLLARRSPGAPGDLERNLAILTALEAITRTLLTRPLVANRLQLHYATVSFSDYTVRGSNDQPFTLSVRGIEGRLEHNWLAGQADLSLRAQLTDSVGRRSNIEISGRRRDDQSITLAVSDLPLAMLGPYLAKSDRPASANGTLSGVLVYRTPSAQHGAVELDWLIRDLDMSIPLREEPSHIESSRLTLQSRIEIHPGRLRLTELELDGLGGDGHLSASGVVERPLRDSARARIASEFRGAGLEELRRMVAWLPATDAEPLTQLLARLDSGRIDTVQARGAARISQWRRLVAGELDALPTGVVLSSDIADVAVATDGPAELTNLSAHAEWSGDRIALFEVQADWNGVPLPKGDAVVNGVSHLLRGPPRDRELQAGAQPLPGLKTLWQIVTRQHQGESDRLAPMPEIQLEIDALDHPALRWPIRNAKLRIAPIAGGVEVTAHQGSWAGANFEGQLRWQRTPEPRWNLGIAIAKADPAASNEDDSHPRQAKPADLADPADPAGPTAPWFRGQIEVGSLEPSGLPASALRARFSVTDAILTLEDVSAQLTPHGTLIGKLVVDLANPERLALSVDSELLDGDLAQIGPLIGLERDRLQGRLWVKSALHGQLDPGLPLLADLSGTAYVLAREGELRREMPTVLALAQAAEGFSPFASGKVARYESVEMTLLIDRGRLTTDNLEVEGPIRVYAEGFLDVARPNPEINAVVGVFLLRQADQAFGDVPLLSQLISDRGLIGSYFELTGSATQPEARSLPLNSIAAAIPDVVKAPFRALGALGRLLTGEDANPPEPPPPAKPSPDWPDSADEWRSGLGELP